MQEKKSVFAWAAIAGAFILGQALLVTGASPAFAQVGFNHEIPRGLVVPPSWVPRWYARTEYLAMWATGNPLPPLVTTSPAGTPRVDAGVWGEPATEVLFGDDIVDQKGRQGGRLTFGYWLDAPHTLAVQAELLAVGKGRQWPSRLQELTGPAFSTGDPILARPFLNTENNLEDAQLIAFPSVATGGIQIAINSEIYSVDVLARYNWLRGCNGYIDFCGGYRFFRFRESLGIRERLEPTLDVFDSFSTENDFHGVDLGAVVGLERGAWLLDVTAKVALGDMRERLSIDGTTALVSDPTVSVPGGWLAAPSNIGEYTGHEFVAIPELGVRLACVAFDIIQLSVGYNVMFVSSVVRTGDQIDRTVNPDQLVALPLARGGAVPSGALRPRPRLDDSELWMHGISFGAELRW